jgi:hypothetical protein
MFSTGLNQKSHEFRFLKPYSLNFKEPDLENLFKAYAELRFIKYSESHHLIGLISNLTFWMIGGLYNLGFPRFTVTMSIIVGILSIIQLLLWLLRKKDTIRLKKLIAGGLENQQSTHFHPFLEFLCSLLVRGFQGYVISVAIYASQIFILLNSGYTYSRLLSEAFIQIIIIYCGFFESAYVNYISKIITTWGLALLFIIVEVIYGRMQLYGAGQGVMSLVAMSISIYAVMTMLKKDFVIHIVMDHSNRQLDEGEAVRSFA